jgi:predicted nucleic-acid-binding protein
VTVLADTNLILRILLADDAVELMRAQALAAKAAAEATPIALTEAVLCELMFVLPAKFGVSRQDTAVALSELLATASFAGWDHEVSVRVLELYGSDSRLDPADCCLLARSELRGEEIASFDKVVNRLAGERAVF